MLAGRASALYSAIGYSRLEWCACPWAPMGSSGWGSCPVLLERVAEDLHAQSQYDHNWNTANRDEKMPRAARTTFLKRRKSNMRYSSQES